MIDGVTTTVKVAHVRLCHVRLCHGRLCHGRMTFVRAHPRESQERVFDAHDRAFALFGGACTKGIHDSGHCPPLVRGQWARRPRWTRSSWAASAPTTAAFSRRAATTGSNPSPARRPRAGRRGRACPAPDAGSRDLRGHGPAALLRAAGEGEEPRGTRRLAGGPLHGLGQGASPSASARRRRFGRRRSGRRRSGRRRSGRRRRHRGSPEPTEPRGASRALRARGASPLVAHLRCASRQRREPSCGAPAVRFAPEARALLWRTCGALRARGASPLVAHLRCDGLHAVPAAVSKTCLVRFDSNTCSVFASAVGRPVEVRAHADRVEVRQDGRVTGRASACLRARQDDPRPLATAVPVLARKPGALEGRRALQGLGAAGRARAHPPQASQHGRWRPADGRDPRRRAGRRASRRRGGLRRGPRPVASTRPM